MSRKRKNPVEYRVKEQLMGPILNKWVAFRINHDKEANFVYIKHVLCECDVYSKVRQIVWSADDFECGVFFVTDYDIRRVFDIKTLEDRLEIIPKRFDLELGIDVGDPRPQTKEELLKQMISKGFIAKEEIDLISNFEYKPSYIDEIILGMSKTEEMLILPNA